MNDPPPTRPSRLARIRGPRDGVAWSEFRPTTWQAFWLCAVEGCAPREASVSLGMSIGAVYAAKCRVLVRLREEIGRARQDRLVD
jgi:DNA-directed RNA polymerase specialized sigma24 family protein